MLIRADKNKFIKIFNPETGFYARTSELKADAFTDQKKAQEMSEQLAFYTMETAEKMLGTGHDPFMADYPELLDIGIMGTCKHAQTGLCAKSGVQCYQGGAGKKYPNMPLRDFVNIMDQISGRTFQVALGGRGDVNKHEEFEGILRCCRSYGVIPNYTTSGLDLTDEEAALTAELCGAVAVSWYDRSPEGYTYAAINKFIEHGVKTNIHFVLGNNSIDEAIERLANNDFPEGINAVVFLLHKPVGLGQAKNVLDINDPKVAQFFQLVEDGEHNFKIGFDSCTMCGILNKTTKINLDTADTCEGARYSAYITSDSLMLPCSFDNQDLFYAVDLKEHTIEEAWYSEPFETFRNKMRFSCSGCAKKELCKGGCPLQRSIVLCDAPEKDLR